MTYFNRKILSILDPTIKLRKLVLPETDTDIDEKTDTLQPIEGKIRTSVVEGGVYPFVLLKDYLIPQKYLKSFSLDFYDDLPRIEFSFRDVAGIFDTEIPMDGDSISVYLRPSDYDNLKPIRVDFDIINISPFFRTDYPTEYTINGVIQIPGFFNDVCKSFKNNTSFEHLQDVCESLGLGFASNETSTDDSMTRICPYINLNKFVSDTVKTAYKDDISFFKWFIDPYYYLCFVNVNKQLSTKVEPEDINVNRSYPTDALYLEKDSDKPQPGKLVLTNKREFARTNIYINSWAVRGEHGRWIKDGYIIRPVIYDIDTKEGNNEKIIYNIESLITEGSESSFVKQKGKIKEKPEDVDFYKTQQKYHWLGKQEGTSIGGNVHDSFIFSNMLNSQNEAELKKINLEVEIDGMNFYIQKYMMIPVEIYLMKDIDGYWKEKRFSERDENLGSEDNIKSNNQPVGDENKNPSEYDGRTQYLNKFLSGFYMVSGIKYIFVEGSYIKTKLTLTRREHNIPTQNNYSLVE